MLALDQLTKAWAVARLHKQPAIILHPGLLEFDFAFNTGSSFGMLSDAPWARTFFIVVTVLVLAYLARLLWTSSTRSRFTFIALGLVLGGTLGNFLDRLFRVIEQREFFSRSLQFSDWLAHGTRIQESLAAGRAWIDVPRHGVVDFIVVYYGAGKTWPAFNVADMALSCGVVLVIWALRKQLAAAPTAATPATDDPAAPRSEACTPTS